MLLVNFAQLADTIVAMQSQAYYRCVQTLNTIKMLIINCLVRSLLFSLVRIQNTTFEVSLK